MEWKATYAFVGFNELPGELRNLIWSFALQDEEDCEIHIKQRLYKYTFDNGFAGYKIGPVGEEEYVNLFNCFILVERQEAW